MKIKKQAERLETFLEDEFKKKVPLAVLPDRSIVYKRFKISQNKQSQWCLRYLGGFDIDTFRLKTTAAIAAKHYDRSSLVKYNEVKLLDTNYWTAAVDAEIFKYRYDNTKDFDRKMLFLCRWELARDKANHYKSEITRMFKAAF